jgi:hypothetical protein
MSQLSWAKRITTLSGKMKIKKEMNNFHIAFKIMNGDEAIPLTYQEIGCHMMFDVKMEHFTIRRALFMVYIVLMSLV